MTFTLAYTSVGTLGVSGTCAIVVSFDTTITVDAVEGIYSGTLAARIYDATSQALVASGPSTTVSGTSSPNRLPLTTPVTLTAGKTYMLGFYVVSSGTSGYQPSLSSPSAGGVTMTAPRGVRDYYGPTDAFPANSDTSWLWPVGVEVTAVGGGGTAATASGSLSLSGTVAAGAAGSVAGSLALTGSAAARVPASASGALSLAGTASAVGAFSCTAVVVGSNVDLSWPAVAASYAIERDGALLAFGYVGTSYVDTPGPGPHSYRVGALA